MKLILLSLLLFTQLFSNIGNIMALKGKADIYRVPNKTVSAKNGMKILLDDTVVTQSKTRTQILLKDDTIITIGANSSFQFDDYFFDGTKKSTLKLKASRGFFRAVTGKIGKLAPKRFSVETRSATIGIRGTDFSAHIYKESETFKCHSGSIVITIGDVTQVLYAGEQYQLLPKQVQAGSKMIERSKEKSLLPSVTEISDIIEVNDNEKITAPIPIIPDGRPCEPCPVESY
ncbi:MAG: FecR family protein [Campylobacterota bacterium]|nr:FecR family protein [Campylobacterota bacterium]